MFLSQFPDIEDSFADFGFSFSAAVFLEPFLHDDEFALHVRIFLLDNSHNFDLLDFGPCLQQVYVLCTIAELLAVLADALHLFGKGCCILSGIVQIIRLFIDVL